jgi:ribosomal protein S18 acetylase RimI-like enzyme
VQVQYGQADSAEELKQILVLQQRNLPGKLSIAEKHTEGFVTVEHTPELLERMNIICGHIIAKDAVAVVGYALCMHPQFYDEISVLKPMFTELESKLPAGYRYMVMGQICVAKAYRGKGIFRGLYSYMSRTLKPAYDGIVTEVDTSNQRSLNAHRAVGFKGIGTYTSGGQDWQLLVLDL